GKEPAQHQGDERVDAKDDRGAPLIPHQWATLAGSPAGPQMRGLCPDAWWGLSPWPTPRHYAWAAASQPGGGNVVCVTRRILRARNSITCPIAGNSTSIPP